MDTIIRVHKDLDADPFARIDKEPINDPNISYKALGILVYVLSKPDGWQVNNTDLANHATDGMKSIRSGIDELIKYKYCQRVKVIEPETKRIKKWILVFYERPYPGQLVELITVGLEPDTQYGNLGLEPDTQKLHVEKLHVEKLHVENGTLNNNRIKQQKKKITKDNNNNIRPEPAAAPVVVVEIPLIQKIKYTKIKNRILNMGWAGSLEEVKKYFIEDPDRVEAWIEKVEGIKGLENPAGLLRKGLRSEETPKTKKAAERDQLKELGLTSDEIEALI